MNVRVLFQDYYAFGMQLDGRSFSSDSYRYGFNGMEKDDEVKGSGNSLDFGARIYDPRVGRWLSRDPLEDKYPSLNPYNFVANSPLIYVDPDGEKIIIHYKDENGNDKQYEYGSGLKKPDNDFVIKTIEALDHLKTTQTGQGIVSRIEKDTKKVLTLTNFTDGGSNVQNAGDFLTTPNLEDKSGNPLPLGSTAKVADIVVNSATISWDPYSSIQFNDGTLLKADGSIDIDKMNASISPATALGHEIGHAYQAFYMFAQFMSGGKSDPQFGNLREKYAIKLIEHLIAKELGEGLRTSHDAKDENLIQTSGPTSNQPTVANDIGEGMEAVKLN